MWTAIYLATGKEMATDIEQKLKEEGFLVKKQFFLPKKEMKNCMKF